MGFSMLDIYLKPPVEREEILREGGDELVLAYAQWLIYTGKDIMVDGVSGRGWDSLITVEQTSQGDAFHTKDFFKRILNNPYRDNRTLFQSAQLMQNSTLLKQIAKMGCKPVGTPVKPSEPMGEKLIDLIDKELPSESPGWDEFVQEHRPTDALSEIINHHSQEGETPLYAASKQQEFAVMEMLERFGADIQIRSKGRNTVVHGIAGGKALPEKKLEQIKRFANKDKALACSANAEGIHCWDIFKKEHPEYQDMNNTAIVGDI